MNTKIAKLNNYLLLKHNKVYAYFAISILILATIFVYFLFMSVSYVYATENLNHDLNVLLAKNMEERNLLVKNETEVEKKLISDNFVRIKNIKYLKNTNDVLVRLVK